MSLIKYNIIHLTSNKITIEVKDCKWAYYASIISPFTKTENMEILYLNKEQKILLEMACLGLDKKQILPSLKMSYHQYSKIPSSDNHLKLVSFDNICQMSLSTYEVFLENIKYLTEFTNEDAYCKNSMYLNQFLTS